MKKSIITTFVLLVFFCCSNSESEAVKPNLLKEIKAYIDKSESNAKQRKTYKEYDIYLIIFSNKESLKKVKIVENTYYFKKNLDGYINIGDNKVFFYHSNENLVNKNLLLKKGLKNIPDENSKEARNDGIDPDVWSFLIEENGKLKKTDYLPEGFEI